MKRICLISFFNLYESKRYFVEKLAEALHRKGVETLMIDPEGGGITPGMRAEITKFSPDFSLSFNASYADAEGKFIWDHLGFPHMMAIVDPAFYAIGFTKSPLAFFTTVDREDCRWLRANGVKDVYFWAHAVEANPVIDPHVEKIYDVVFLGTCTDFEGLKLKWHQELNDAEISILDHAIERMFAQPLCSLTEALASSVEALNIRVEGVNFQKVFQYLDNYVRGRDRFELIRSLKGVQVHVFGEASWHNPSQTSTWSQYLANESHITLHPAVSYKDSFRVMQQAKICINSSPFFKYGSHERILNAFMMDSLPLTTHNQFVEEFFAPGEDLLTYLPGQWELVSEQVKSLIESEGDRKEMVAKGKGKVLAGHTWDHRVDELFSIWKQVQPRFKP